MNKDVGQELIILRAKKNWTQEKLAQELGITQRSVVAWENGDSIPRKTMLVKIAKVFELPEDYFLTDTDLPVENSTQTGDLSGQRELKDQKPDVEKKRMVQVTEEFEELMENTPLDALSENSRNRIRKVLSEIMEEEGTFGINYKKNE